MKQFIKKHLFKILYIILAIFLALPAYYYILKNKTIIYEGLEFRFLLIDNNRILQAVLYFIVITTLIIMYLIILKYRKKIFDSFKEIFIYILVFSSVFICTIPFCSHDVYYYMGIGRLNSKYKQNPYYISMKEYIDNESYNIDFSKDTVIENGYKNFWSEKTVVYGPTWTLICAVLTKMSFGNIGVCFFMFKIAGLLIHMANCYLIYKISRKKLFALIYGLNPYIVFEAIINMHNDIFMVFFIILSFYELLRKKSIAKSIIFMGIATTIKYYAILFLPFTIIYYYRKEKESVRLKQCIKYGVLFFITVIILYLLYFRNFSVLNGIIEQQNKYSKSLSIVLIKYGYGRLYVHRKLLFLFTIYYIIRNIKLLVGNEVKIGKEMKQLFYYLLIFTFLLVTNFQPWYIVWLIPVIIWQEPKNIRLIVQITIIALYGYIIFIIYDDTWKVGANYSIMLMSAISILIFANNLIAKIKTKRLRGGMRRESIEK